MIVRARIGPLTNVITQTPAPSREVVLRLEYA